MATAGIFQYLPQKAPSPVSPLATQVQQLAAQGVGSPNITGMPVAKMLNDPSMWIQKHPYAVSHGKVPAWVSQDLLTAAHGNVPQSSGIDANHVLHDVINFHRQNNGLPAMHPNEIHQRVTDLAHEILGSRNNRFQNALHSIAIPPAGIAGIGPIAPAGSVGRGVAS